MATPEQLAELFAGAWPNAAGKVPDIGTRLAELLDEAHKSYPALEIDDRDLILQIAKRAPAAGDLANYLQHCHAGDLAVASQAARGSQGAIAELERAHRNTIEAACRRFAGPGQTADDLKQILRAKLFVAEKDKTPKISDYAGQGFLDNWLRVTAVRVFLDLTKRKDRTRESSAEDDDILALPNPNDLQLDVVKAEYRTAVTAAMHEGAQALEPGDRHLLRQHFVAGLSIDQLGAVLGIHRATAARRISRAREQLVAETRKQLAAKLKLADSEVDEVMGLVMSRLDVSIAKLLATKVSEV
ncbi:MAG: sigma-70 family RNA polymerase sigma factor [Deltaproteobacteria bacterium]|nr:sigma-70 family RNA polymerase sigma factor [Deltaproteobacteria bacterium]